jgi:hypothetical protein
MPTDTTPSAAPSETAVTMARTVAAELTRDLGAAGELAELPGRLVKVAAEYEAQAEALGDPHVLNGLRTAIDMQRAALDIQARSLDDPRALAARRNDLRGAAAELRRRATPGEASPGG